MKSSLLIVCLIVAARLSAQNLVSSQSWTLGSGNVGMFQANETVSSENVREMGTDPFGNQSIVWKGVASGDGNNDGGWTTDTFPIDRTRMYRFAVWMKKTNSNDGYSYFGCQWSAVTDLSGNQNDNPYFWVGDLPELNKWYLLVAYIHGSSDPSTSSYGGIYDGVTGQKVLATTDFKFTATATTAVHRAYLFYDVNSLDRQYFFGPEVYKMSDNAPPAEILTNLIIGGSVQANNGATIYKTYADTDLNTSWSGS